MDIERYFERRKQLELQKPKYRELCTRCIQPRFSCYCQHIQRFDPKIDFIILIHPIEVRRRIATGRMAHLSLENSQLIRGQDFSNVLEVNQILADPNRHCVILYPGKTSRNLSHESVSFPTDKKLTIFVIDGTWLTAKKMMSRSRNLFSLPRICFTPTKPSAFKVRKQPKSYCYSTIEAIHETIDLIGNQSSRAHDSLLNVFSKMVDIQVECAKKAFETGGPERYRRPKLYGQTLISN